MFRFEEETHSYFLGAERLPGVTSILKPLYDFSAVPPDVLQRAALYGTAVHKTVELYLMGDLDETDLDPALALPLDGFKRWQDDHPDYNMDTADIEAPGYHPKLKYAGTPDLDGEDFLIDLKSRPVNMLVDPLQLAAYNAFRGGDRDRFVLELRQDGTYQFTHVNKTKKSSNEAWSRFRYLLDFYRMGETIQKWRNK